MRAVLNDEGARLMLRFGAARCGLVEVEVGVVPAPDAADVRADLERLTVADARRAAEAVLNDPLVGTDDRGRPEDQETKGFTRAVSDASEKHLGRRLTSTITRSAAHSVNLDHAPGPDVQLLLDLLACHMPSKTAEAVADLIRTTQVSS